MTGDCDKAYCSHAEVVVPMIERVQLGLYVVRSPQPRLVLPSSYARQRPVTSDWRVLLLWSEVNQTAPSDRESLGAQLRERLRRIGRLRGLRLITAINCLSLSRGQERLEVQVPLATEMSKPLAPEFAQRVMSFAREGRIVFASEHLAILAGCIVQLGVDQEPESADVAICAFMEAVLILNELYGAEQLALRARAQSDLPDTASEIESYLPIEVRSAAFDTDHSQNVIWRLSRFVEWAREQDRSSRDFCDVDSALREVFKLSYEEIVVSWLLLKAYWNSFQSVKDLQERDAIIDLNFLLAPFTDTRTKQYVEAMSVPLSQLATELQGRDGMTAAAVLPLQKRPLIEVVEGHYACPIPTFLENAIGAGLYHRLAEHFQTQGRRSRFHHFFARFLQDYALSITATAVERSNALVIAEFKYRDVKQTKDSSDFIVIEGRTALFFDICNKRLNTESSLHEQDLASIRADIDAMVLDQAKQLNGRIADFRAGKYTLKGMTSADIDEIVPIAVTHQSIHGWAGTRAYIDRRLREREYLQTGPRLEIVSLVELETLIRAFDGALSLSELFRRRRTHPEEVARARSLNNFLLLHGEWNGKDKRAIPGFEDWMASTVQNHLIAWGINADQVQAHEPGFHVPEANAES